MFRKFILLVFLVAGPPAMTAAFYIGTRYMLAATSRTIDRGTFDAITLAEIVLFYFGAFLEVRSRWSLQTSDM